jgi:hypothetical protein
MNPYSTSQRETGSTGPRTVRRPRDFWYSSMSAGAAPFSGQARTMQTALSARK